MQGAISPLSRPDFDPGKRGRRPRRPAWRRAPSLAWRIALGAALLLSVSVSGVRLAWPQERSGEREERIHRLEGELERARRAGKDAEVREIRELLRRLRRHDAPRELPPAPFVIDCGPPGDEDGAPPRERGGGLRIVADRTSSSPGEYGHVGGEGVARWFNMVWGRPDPGLFVRARVALRAYRLPLPPGDYLLGLGFCEGHHQIAGRRVFDIAIEGEQRTAALDLFSLGGFDRAFRLMYRVRVTGPEGLEVAFHPRRGEPLLNALWVYPAPARDAPPGPPPVLRATGSYGAVVLDWDPPADPSVAAMLIERSAAGGEFRPLLDEPTVLTRWIDREAGAGRPYRYRLLAVTVDGRRSAPGPAVTAIPRDRDRSTLPAYGLEIPEESLTYLLGRVNEDRTVRAVFSLGGREFPIEIRLRGAVTRLAEKKSYRIRFVEEVPAGLRRVTYLKAEPHDFTLQREKLSCDLFASLGLPVSEARLVNLFINDEYRGVYLDIEPIRAPFKRRAGLDPEGTLLRARTFQHLDEGPPGELRGKQGGVGQLEEFLRRVQRVERGEFAGFLRRSTDWPRLRDYLVASVLCHRSEIEADDSFYYRDPTSGRWSIIPWDHNNGNFGLQGLEPRIPEPFMDIRGQTLQAIGYGPRYWYVLPSRILHEEVLRGEYLDRLEELTRDLLLSGRAERWIGENFAALREEVPLDPYRWPRQETGPFLSSQSQLCRFVRQHGRRILEQVERERRREREALVINEFQFGDREGWVEVHNRGPVAVSLSGYRIGDIEGRFATKPLGGGILEGGAYRVFRFEHRPLRSSRLERPGGHDEDGEARERREIEERRQRRSHFPGFSPSGGSVGLLAPPRERGRETDDERDDRLRLVDWYFYGKQDPALSYGRLGRGFARLEPTPGRANLASSRKASGTAR